MPVKNQKKKTSPFKGWSKRSPKKGSQREEMMKKCGKKCFLSPADKAFPVCPYSKKPSCKVDRAGVLSAYVRARQWKHEAVASKASKMLKTVKFGFRDYFTKKDVDLNTFLTDETARLYLQYVEELVNDFKKSKTIDVKDKEIANDRLNDIRNKYFLRVSFAKEIRRCANYTGNDAVGVFAQSLNISPERLIRVIPEIAEIREVTCLQIRNLILIKMSIEIVLMIAEFGGYLEPDWKKYMLIA